MGVWSEETRGLPVIIVDNRPFIPSVLFLWRMLKSTECVQNFKPMVKSVIKISSSFHSISSFKSTYIFLSIMKIKFIVHNIHSQPNIYLLTRPHQHLSKGEYLQFHQTLCPIPYPTIFSDVCFFSLSVSVPTKGGKKRSYL